MILLAFAVAFVVGLSVLACGIRGTRVDDAPHCRTCGFDVSAHEIGYAACPECGSRLTLDNIVFGHRTRSPAKILFGTFLIVPSVLLFVVTIFSPGRLLGSLPNAPLIWLADGTGDQRMVAELASRMGRKAISQSDANLLVHAAIRRQQDPRKSWLVDWGNIVDDAILRGWVSDEDLKRYLSQAVVMDMILPVRANAGSIVQPKIRYVGAGGWNPSAGELGALPVEYRFDIHRAVIGGKVWPLEQNRAEDHFAWDRMRSISGTFSSETPPSPQVPPTWASLAPLDAPSGSHEVVIDIIVTAMHPNDPLHRQFSWPVTLTHTMQVRAAGESLITLVAEPAQVQAVRDRIRVKVRQVGPKDHFEPELRAECIGPAVSVCMRAEVWAGQDCWRSRGLALMEYQANARIFLPPNNEPIPLMTPRNQASINVPRTVRVRFIPDKGEAADAGMLDIIDGPIEFPDVPVE